MEGGGRKVRRGVGRGWTEEGRGGVAKEGGGGWMEGGGRKEGGRDGIFDQKVFEVEVPS